MKNINKMAAADAARWAAAEMAYGEGAGTRRRLLDAELSSRWNIPGYMDAFEGAYDKLDMDKFAKAAIKERKLADTSNYVSKNVRALVRGDVRNVSPSLLVLVAGGYFAHKQGYDKVVLQRVKVEYRLLANKFDRWRKTSDSPLAEVFYTDADSRNRDFDIDKPYGGI